MIIFNPFHVPERGAPPAIAGKGTDQGGDGHRVAAGGRQRNDSLPRSALPPTQALSWPKLLIKDKAKDKVKVTVEGFGVGSQKAAEAQQMTADVIAPLVEQLSGGDDRPFGLLARGMNRFDGVLKEADVEKRNCYLMQWADLRSRLPKSPSKDPAKKGPMDRLAGALEKLAELNVRKGPSALLKDPAYANQLNGFRTVLGVEVLHAQLPTRLALTLSGLAKCMAKGNDAALSGQLKTDASAFDFVDGRVKEIDAAIIELRRLRFTRLRADAKAYIQCLTELRQALLDPDGVGMQLSRFAKLASQPGRSLEAARLLAVTSWLPGTASRLQQPLQSEATWIRVGGKPKVPVIVQRDPSGQLQCHVLDTPVTASDVPGVVKALQAAGIKPSRIHVHAGKRSLLAAASGDDRMATHVMAEYEQAARAGPINDLSGFIDRLLDYNRSGTKLTPRTQPAFTDADRVSMPRPIGSKVGPHSAFAVTLQRPDRAFDAVFEPFKDAPGDAARRSGVPTDEPRLANRSVATRAYAKALGFDVIPDTQVAWLTTAADGRGKPQLGLAWERPRGRPAADIDAQTLRHPSLVREMTKLQLLDHLTGHVDRHADSYFVHLDASGRARVAGTRNDASFGKLIEHPDDIRHDRDVRFMYYGTRLPPVVDTEMAAAINALDAEALEQMLGDQLSEPELSAAAQRLHLMKQYLAGGHGPKPRLIEPSEWGKPENLALLEPDNSYWAREMADAQQRA